jgi:hypothetical protein
MSIRGAITELNKEIERLTKMRRALGRLTRDDPCTHRNRCKLRGSKEILPSQEEIDVSCSPQAPIRRRQGSMGRQEKVKRGEVKRGRRGTPCTIRMVRRIQVETSA